MGDGHTVHAMVLDYILADIKKGRNRQAILNSKGDGETENFKFKFKNTDRQKKNNTAI